jgi:arsenate reductase-like glutaredoxin family protein
MWKEIAANEPPKTTGPAKKWREEFEKKYPSVKAAPKPVTEDELRAIFDRLDVARDIFRQNRELREILSGLETETRELRSRNAELEEIMRKFAPLLDAATAMGLAANNEKPEPENYRSLEEQGDQVTKE